MLHMPLLSGTDPLAVGVEGKTFLINTFYLRLYGVRHMIKDYSDSQETCCHYDYTVR